MVRRRVRVNPRTLMLENAVPLLVVIVRLQMLYGRPHCVFLLGDGAHAVLPEVRCSLPHLAAGTTPHLGSPLHGRELTGVLLKVCQVVLLLI